MVDLVDRWPVRPFVPSANSSGGTSGPSPVSVVRISGPLVRGDVGPMANSAGGLWACGFDLPI